MANKIEKYDMKNVQLSEDPCSVKEEAVQPSDFEDVKVHVSETAIIIGNIEFQDNLRPTKIKQEHLATSLDNIKTELSLYEVQCNMRSDNISGINGGDIKIEFDSERLLYCGQCNAYYEDYCMECGMLIRILNKIALSSTDDRAQEELPYNVLEIQDTFGQFGIYTLKAIPKGVIFGPFTGLSRSECPWKIKSGKFIVNETKRICLNWMQYVNPARNTSEQNLLVFQFEGCLYYKSTRQIQKGDQLLVYFSEECEDNLNNDVELDFTPPMEIIPSDAFACSFCCLGFNSISHLAKHKSVCCNDAAGGFLIQGLKQCPFCKVHFDQREYSEYHMAYCNESNFRKCVLPAPSGQTAEAIGGNIRRRPIYNCERCGYKTKYKGDLKNHTNEHYEVKMYKCGICYRRFNTKESLRLHVENAHATANQDPQHSTDVYMKAHIKAELPYSQDGMKCSLCEFRTKYKGCMKRHTKAKHLKEFDHKCDLCDYKTNGRSNLEKHIKTIHLAEFDHSCDFCPFRTNIVTRLRNHINSQHLKRFDYRCDACNFRTNHKSNLENHIKMKHVKQFRYECSLCEFKTYLKVRLESHVKRKHLKMCNYRCDICDYKTVWKSYLKIHIKTQHLKQYEYKCETCDYKTNQKPSLDYHVKTKHLKKFKYKCESCDYATNQKGNLEGHVKSKHLQQFNYNCDACDYRTNMKMNFECHRKSKHLNEFNYECDRCDYQTNLRTNFEYHVNSKHLNEFNYKCDSCEYRTNNKSDYEIHRKTQHLKVFDYKCELCAYEVNRKDRLDKHVKTKHLKEFDYKCDKCDYKAHLKSSFDNHMKSKHLKTFDYKCETCDFATNRRDNLQYHINTRHLNEFNHKCDRCDFKTYQKSKLEKHIKTKHLKEFDYKCDSCDFKRNRKDHLKYHIKTKHSFVV